MAEIKWTSTSAMKEFLRRERDILKKHRMPQDMATDLQELRDVVVPGGNGNGEAPPGFHRMPDGSLMPNEAMQ